MTAKFIGTVGIVLALLGSLSTFGVQGADAVKTAEIFQAAEIARSDLVERLKKERKDWEYATYVADIHNYNIGLSESKDFYTVVFLLKKTSVKINGGGGEYTIKKGNLKIVGFKGYE